jgi:lysophospholipase L1-like esterase
MMFTLAFAALVAIPSADPKPDPFVFQENDRVVFVGGTLIEREQKFGHWETALTLKNSGKKVTFRNLGWSGDTVWCESRGSFDPASKGFDRTVALVKELKPTVIVICYGHVESFDGEAGLKKFQEGLGKLLDGFAPTKARVVLMSPTPFQNVGPFQDGYAKNTRLTEYVKVMEKMATEKQLGWVNLFQNLTASDIAYTENGFHLSGAGYAATLPALVGEGTKQADALRQKIVEKNELFFHRWRPQNQTYLFGFRKHEQGQNAKEIVEFDPLIEAAEKEIAKLRTSANQ